jgi:mannosylglycerate hydrolase MGH1-like protein
MNAEQQRLLQATGAQVPWRKWGPYLSERQWGTVREDYSEDGNAWDYFSHDQARSRAYRWGEDGLGGISDDQGHLNFAIALWNGNDPILKERLFGLTNSEGNHGEDVKEYYFYLDSTPTHSYMKYLYKYPHAAYPYDEIVKTNRTRSRSEREYELIDTGVFDDDAYFDVFVEYAKSGPEDIAIKISIHNRGRRAQRLHLLPTLWYRNMWADDSARPELHTSDTPAHRVIHAHPSSDLPLDRSPGDYRLWCEGSPELLFTENDTNNERVFGTPNTSRYVKDAFHEYLIKGRSDAVNPARTGTKAAAHYVLEVEPGAVKVVRLRLQGVAPRGASDRRPSEILRHPGEPFETFDAIVQARRTDADEFYRGVTPPTLSADEASVMRQALAGMLWSKQHYTFDADEWLREHGAHPLQKGGRAVRNHEWFHMINSDVISMPDKWEYPWYAAWDLAFHTVALSIVDPEFARTQLTLMLGGRYIHPNGQMPAYEWNFSDVNPPVHAWATLFMYRMQAGNEVSLDFLRSAFFKLSLNFTWWVNRKDREGRNLFEGGFLGLDNIGVFDRSSPLPTGGHLEQADGTAWMAFFSQCMADFAVELAGYDRSYEDMAAKYVEHFLWIAYAMNAPGKDGMWDEADGFYYDILRKPDGSATRLKVRSMVGLLPLCATRIIEPWQREQVPTVIEYLQERVRRMPELFQAIHPTGEKHRGVNERGIMALVNPERLRRILSRMLDENEFLSPYGIRSLSKAHAEHPYVFNAGGRAYTVAYEPGESNSGMFGGNSNWRGPIWMPVNVLLISALLNYYLYYGDSFKVECPTGSGQMLTLFEVAKEIGARLNNIFLRDGQGRRAVFGAVERFQNDPHFRDHVPFYEFFHGDTGEGLGASHQTGWTGLVAKLLQIFGNVDAPTYLRRGNAPRHHAPEVSPRAESAR